MARVVISVQALRAFVYGFGAVVLGTALAAEGLGDAAVGAIFTAMLGGMALATSVIGRLGHHIDRRLLYRALLTTMGIAGAVFALTSSLPLLLAAAATGTLSTDANESGPITSIEQAILGGAPADARARIFGRYNAAAYLAGSVGALCAGGPAAFRHVLPRLPADQRFLLVFPVIAAACVAIAGRLPAAVPPPHPQARRGSGALGGGSRPSVRRLAALFAVDAFGGGMVVSSFVVFWFHRRYGAPADVMGAVLFGTGLLQAGSSLVAGWLAPRLGLVRTMVFTHLPSNLLLAAVPLMPGVGWAIAALLARSALSQMDVPARQAFLAAIVEPHERTAAAAYTNAARYAGRPAGPAVAGALMQRTALAAPFLAAAAIKVGYDLAVYARFRGIESRLSSGGR